MKNSFDELTGVSPLWFSVEKDEGAGVDHHSLGTGRGYEMFGDWRIEESLVDVFEDQIRARSHKEVHKHQDDWFSNGLQERKEEVFRNTKTIGSRMACRNKQNRQRHP